MLVKGATGDMMYICSNKLGQAVVHVLFGVPRPTLTYCDLYPDMNFIDILNTQFCQYLLKLIHTDFDIKWKKSEC